MAIGLPLAADGVEEGDPVPELPRPSALPGAEALEVLRSRAGRSKHRPDERPGARPRPELRGAAVLLLAVALVAGVVAWRWVGRPAPLEERMPMAEGAGASSTAPSAPASASATTAAADPTSTRARPEEVVVHVVGAVLAPGVVHVAAGARVVDAVAAAGGLAPGADAQRVNLAAPVADGSRIVVPAVGVEVPAEVPTSAVAAAGGPGGTTGGGATAAAGPVELNTATAEQLDGLPGVGPATAEAILAYREANGPFTSVEQLLDVRGIGEAKLESLRDLVVVR